MECMLSGQKLYYPCFFLQHRPIRIAVPRGPSHTLTGDVGIRLSTLSATSQVVCQVLLDK